VLEVGVLLERLERLAAENGRLRLLEERAGSLERQVETERSARENAEQELFAIRARIVELESRPRRRWFSRARSESPRTVSAA
jgi:chromosome segregation ATPase